MKPIPSPTEEIRSIRHQLAEAFGNNLQRIIDDLRRQQSESGKEYVRLPKRLPTIGRSINSAN